MSDSADRSKLIAGIEACRPGSADLELSDLSFVAQAINNDEEAERLYAQVQQSDTALAKAFREVTAPEGLQERLLAGLAAEETPAAESPQGNVCVEHPSERAEEAVVPAAPAKRATTKWTSRQAVGFGAAAACILVAVTLAVNYFGQEEPLSADEVAAIVADLHAQDAEDWKDDLSAAPVARPVTKQLKRSLNPTQWRMTTVLGDQQAVAYRYSSPRRARATLYVFNANTKITALPSAPPMVPQLKSGTTVGAWTASGLVYVLVVDGTKEQYQGFLRSTSIVMLTRPPAAGPHILPIPHHG